MKRGLKWTIIAAACLLICMLAGAACASGAADGPIITFESVSDDGTFWLDDAVQVWIDATDAAAVYVKDTYDTAFTPLHGNFSWGLDDENGWGARNERIRIERGLPAAGAFTVTVRAYWGSMTATATPPDPSSLPSGVVCKESSATIQVVPRGTLSAPGVSTNLDAQSSIARGNLLDVSVTPGEGNRYELFIRRLDGNGQPVTTGDPVAYKTGNRTTAYYFPTWDMTGSYVLTVYEYKAGYLPGTATIPFTVATGANYTAPTAPVWSFSKQAADTEEAFDVSVYIPGSGTEGQAATELSVIQDGEEVWNTGESGRFCCLRGITLHSDSSVTFRARISYVNANSAEYTYNAFTVNQAVDAPVPAVTGLGSTHRIGTDLGFTIGIAEGETAEPIAGRHVTYQVRFSRDEDAAVSREGTGAVTIPWSTFAYQRPEGNDPGERVTLYIRASGRGYNAKEIRKEIILCEEEDANFRIAFAGTTSGHIRLPVRDGSRVQFQLPADTSGIEYIELYTESTGWESLPYGPGEIPAAGISIGPAAHSADNSPIVARYVMADETARYSNTLLVDYYNNGPLPALQVTTNLTMTGGAYHIRRGDFIQATVGNPGDFTGKGDDTRFILTVTDRSEGSEQEKASSSGELNEYHTEAGLPTWQLEARQEPYTLRMRISTCDSMWDDSTVEVPLYVDQDAEPAGDIRIGATSTQPGTLETTFIHAYAPGAQRIELFRGTKNACESAGTYQNEYAYCSLNAENTCTAHFWARAYYADNTMMDSDVLTIRVTAPHGALADVLTASLPVYPEGYEDLTIRTVSRDTGNPVITDRLYVTLRRSDGGTEREYTAVRTDETVIPAWAEDETYAIEPGRVYEITVKAYKQGYEPATFTKTVFAVGGSGQNTAVLTVNGQSAAALENGTEYTVSITGLPAGVTSVAILEADGSTWDYTSPEAGATSVTKAFTPHTAKTQTEIYAVYSTSQSGGAWDGWTNAVPVTISCDHMDTVARVFWDESTCTSNGKKSHTRSGHGEKRIICRDCEAKLTFVEEVSSATEAHTFRGGICSDCGYACPHEAGDIAHASMLEEGGTATAVDKHYHHVQGTRIEYDWCTNCGEYAGTETRTAVDGNEKHDYDENYTCALCGYKSENSYLNIYPDGCQETVTVQPGGSATLGVRAESDLSSTFTYQWYEYIHDAATGSMERVPLEGETGATVTLSNITAAAEPFVTVSDGYVSREQRFTVRIDNAFYAHANGETDIITESYSTPTMLVSAYCRDGALTYRWYRRVNGADGSESYQPVTGVDAPALTAEPVTENERYECRVEDMYGNHETVGFNLWIDTNLTVTADGGENVKAARGSDVTLSVTATGELADRVTYTWYKPVPNDEGFEEDQLIPGATGRSLTVSNVTKNMRFSVEVTDGVMTQYVFFTVTLDTQLDLYISGDNNLTVDYGVPLTLTAVATDMFGGTGISYYWYRDYVDPVTHKYYSEPQGDTPQITATPIRSQVYYCMAWNEYEDTSAGVKITVRTNLSAGIEGPDRVTAPYGGPLTLTVNATGLKNTFEYTWYSSNADGTGRTKIEGATGAELTIAAVTEPKIYSCDVSDGIEKTSCPGVTVEPDTELTALPDGPAAFIAAGEPVTMTVSAGSLLGADAITYRWSRTGGTGSAAEEIAGATGASLTETPAGAMSYRCDVTDGSGTAYVIFRIFDGEGADYYNGMSRFDAEYGESVTMGVVAADAGEEAISYQWYSKGQALPGATGSTLTVTATETTDYACAVFFGSNSEPFVTLPFEIHISNEILTGETQTRVLWVIPQEGLTLTVNAESEHGGGLAYQWLKDGNGIQGQTGSSLSVAYEEANKLTRYSCLVSDIYSNTAELVFTCMSGTPAEIQADTAVACGAEETFVRFTPAVTAVYSAALSGGENGAGICLPQGSEYEALLAQGTTEVRLKAGQTYYIHLMPGQTLTLATPQQAEQEAYSFRLRRGERIEVPALVINGRSYEPASLTSGDATVLYASGNAIRALKNGQATVTAEYEGGIATRTFTISVTNGRTLDLPSGLTEIMAGAFEGDTSLQFVYLPNNVQHVRRGAFANTGSVTFYVESAATGFDDGAFTGASPAIICDSGSQAADYCMRNGLLFFYR